METISRNNLNRMLQDSAFEPEKSSNWSIYLINIMTQASFQKKTCLANFALHCILIQPEFDVLVYFTLMSRPGGS